MASLISANSALSTYSIFNATDIKQFVINQLKSGNEQIFTDVDYLGSNMNAFIDIISVMLQQMLFNLSTTSSESTFSSAVLYESMSKLVSILGYKPLGKQTSMLPVNLSINLPNSYILGTQFSVPKFLSIDYNDRYVLSNNITTELSDNSNSLLINTVLHQGNIQESPIFTATGNEFETIVIKDEYISTSSSFISDNFFTVYVKESEEDKWEEWTETTSIFLENSESKKYEKRFNEKFNYEFKFGNGTNGKKMPKNAKIVIYYLISSGETSQIGNNIIINKKPSLFSSVLYTEILEDLNLYNDELLNATSYITVSNNGPSTAISYPESVESMRLNAPKIFASQNRLFTLDDYKSFILKNFPEFCKDAYFMTNDEYISTFLKYYYDMGIDAPQKDSRVNISQVEFMTSTNFNNIYACILPKVNTIIDGLVPNYLNTALKREIIDRTNEYKGVTHNIVPIDPIYRAFTWGSSYIPYDEYNKDQLNTKLVVTRNTISKYSIDYIKENVAANLLDYFNTLSLGSEISLNDILESIKKAPGVNDIYIEDINGNKSNKISLYYWNPLYASSDCDVSFQTVINNNFVYPYFYNIYNITNTISVIDDN